MKNLTFIFSLLIWLPTLQAQTVEHNMFIDFGPASSPGIVTVSPDENGYHWNNITKRDDPVNLVDTMNVSTGITLTLTNAILTNGGNAYGGLTDPSSELLGNLAVVSATQDYFCTQTGQNGTSSSTMKFSGLDVSKGYRFEVFGSRSATTVRVSKYIFKGETTVTGTLQVSGSNIGGEGVHGNNSTLYSTPVIYPDANGEIIFELAIESGGLAYVNMMRLQQYSQPKVPVTSIDVSGPNISGNGQTSQMTAVVLPVNATVKDVTWSVDDPSIASINNTGLLSPKRNGTVTVTATSKETGSTVSGSAQITITGITIFPVTLKITDETKTITKGSGTGENVIAAISANLKEQNPRDPNPSDWWYPMYADATYTPKGLFTDNDNAFVWEITLNAVPGSYSWTPYLKSTGWKYLNSTYVYADNPVINFTVNEDGTIDGMTELVIPNVKYEITLQVIDKKGGLLTSATAFQENNVVAWISGGLNTTTSWFYGFYSGDPNYPDGKLIKSEEEWIWQATFKAPPGAYEWNPSMRSLGQTGTEPRTINGNVEGVTWPGANLKFTVSPTGELSGDYRLIMDPDIVIEKTYLTLHVDMNGETVEPEGVFVAGTFNDWSSNSTKMKDEDGDGIYTAKIEVTKSPAAPYQYKFLNGTSWANAEVVFGECEFRSSRLAWVIDGSVEMEPVAFGYCGAAPEEITRIKIACVGGSTTEGAGTSSKYLYSWPVVLREFLGDDYYVENTGVAGTTLQNIPGQAWSNTDQYRYAKLLNPDIMLMGLGGNDSKPSNWNEVNFTDDYIRMIEEFQALPSHPLLYLNCTNKYRANSFGIDDERYVNYVIAITLELARKYMLPVIDYHSTTSPESMAPLFPDGVHPNDEGARVIAEKIAEVLLTPRPVIKRSSTFGISPYYGFCWYLDGKEIENTDMEAISVTKSGTYNVAVKLYEDARDIIISEPYYVEVPAGETVDLSLHSLTTAIDKTPVSEPVLFWNNDSRKLIVKGAEKATLKVYGLNGVCVKESKVDNPYESIDIPGVQQGVYICKLEFAGHSKTIKIVL